MSLSKGVDIEFRDLCFTLATRDKAELQILKNVSGTCKSGRLLAIMGASGAGKTTLLDVLANNVFGGHVEGTVLVNGKPRQRKEFQKLSCYVQQKDVLLASATVREAITTAALLKLPRSITLAEKMQKVEDILQELELMGCADTLIGDELIGLKGISGGQKRRVSVGIELVKDPALVFLDEPTSGLDSEMALTLIQTLRKLSRKGRTVICTIHQPNSDITDNFDDFHLLAKGRTIYNGLWATAVEYFEKNGYSCPLYKNPTDFFMSIIKDPDVANKLADDFALQKAKRPALAGMPRSDTAKYASRIERAPDSPTRDDLELTEIAITIEQPMEVAVTTPSQLVAEREPKASPQAHTAPIWLQVWVLWMRMLRNWVRNPIMLMSELVQYMFVALFIGLMYCKFPDDAQEGTFNRLSCIWFAFAVLSFTPSYTAVTNWEKERHLLKRELGQGLYTVSSFYVARTVALVPFEVLQCAMFTGVMYFFAGFQTDPAKFFMFLAFLLTFQLISESVGFICAVITKQATYAIILLTFILLLLLSFSGFLVATIPIYFRWLNKASYLTYAYVGLAQSEFSGLTLYQQPGDVPVSGLEVLPSMASNGFSAGANLGILIAQLFGYEVLKLAALQLAHRLHSLS